MPVQRFEAWGQEYRPRPDRRSWPAVAALGPAHPALGLTQEAGGEPIEKRNLFMESCRWCEGMLRAAL
jgi:hypothetical protein